MSKRPAADTRGDAPQQGKSGTRRYHRATPDFWSNIPTVSQTLYPTVVTLDCPSTMKPCAPMLILTRRPLPVFEPYNSFFKGVPVTTRLSNTGPVKLNPDQLRNLALFTLRVCRNIMNKPLISTLDDMLYWFAPMCSYSISAGEIPGMPILECISWEVVTQTVTARGISINAESSDTIEQDIQDAIIQDRCAEFTRRYEVVTLQRDMTPHSLIANDLVRSVRAKTIGA
jgi:endoribonuclease Dicer